jgi:RNA polymerase sigma-70 factor, ECF subfamily
MSTIVSHIEGEGAGSVCNAADGNTFFRHLLDDHGDHLLRVCIVYLNQVQYAEDAVQETFIKAYQSRKTEQITDPRQQRAWLTRIAINTCKDMLRSSEFRRERFPLPAEALSAAAPSRPNYELLSVVQTLPVKQREVIILYYYQELRMDEIAKLLRISKTTVHYRLRKAKEALRIQLKGSDDDE